MAKKDIAIVIMAAGKGTRMKSDLPKVLTLLNDKPLMAHVLSTARALNPKKIVVIVGYKRDQVIAKFASDDINFATQEPQLGTGHAVAQAKAKLADFDGDVVTLSGDVPRIRQDTIERLITAHQDNNALITLLTLDMDEPGSYGRVIRHDGEIVKLVEAKDATSEELKTKEINCGIYVFNKDYLFTALESVDNNNAQGEYYLTDLLNMAVADDLKVLGLKTIDPTEALGVNNVEDLEALAE